MEAITLTKGRERGSLSPANERDSFFFFVFVPARPEFLKETKGGTEEEEGERRERRRRYLICCTGGRRSRVEGPIRGYWRIDLC